MNTLHTLALVATKHNGGKPHPHPRKPGGGKGGNGGGGAGHQSVSDWLNGFCPAVGPIDTWGEWLPIFAVVGLVLLFLACRPGAVIRFAVRYVFGAPLFTERRTNAKFFVDGDGWAMTRRNEPYFAGRTPSRWSLLAGWKVAALRVGVPFAVFVIGVAWASDPVVTRWVLTLSGGVALGLLSFRGFRWWATREHRNTYVKPLAQVLAPHAGWAPEVKSKRWLDVPEGFREDGAEITVALNPEFLAGRALDEQELQTWAGSQKSTRRDQFNEVVFEKLGLNAEEMSATFQTVGAHPSVTYRHRERVPEKVSIEDAREAMMAASDTAPVIGFTRGRKPVSIDLTADSPHFAVSLDSGAGKSVLTGGFGAQFLARGGRVLLCDIKRSSHLWVRLPDGTLHPHVRWVRDVAEIHEELLAAEADMERRQHVADDPTADVGPRVLILVEEMNMLANKLTTWWKANKPSGAPAEPPSITAMKNLAFAGRQARMHNVGVAQRFDAKVVGGGDARINYPSRAIRGDASAWRMLAPEFRRPSSPRRAGRFHLAQPGRLDEVQSTYWLDTDDPATYGPIQEWAWSCFPEGTAHRQPELSREEFYTGAGQAEPTPAAEPVNLDKPEAPAPAEGFPPPVVEGETKPADDVTLRDDEAETWADIERRLMAEDSGEPDSSSAGSLSERPAAPEPEPEPVGVGLRQASCDQGEGLVPVTLAALRKASQRDTEFPPVVREQGREKFYDPDALVAWERNRPRANTSKAPTEGSK